MNRTASAFTALILINILILFVSCSKDQKTGTVTAQSGLVLREAADKNSPRIRTIPFNAQVVILDDQGPTEMISNIVSQWYKISYKNKTGWVFGAFIRWDNIPGKESASVAQQSPLTSEAAEKKISDIILNPLSFQNGSRNTTVEELKKMFGAPISTVSAIDHGVHGLPDKVTSYKMQYDGMYIYLYAGTSIFDVIISSDKYKLKYGIKAGMPAAEIENILGKPQIIRDGSLIYHINEFGDKDSFSGIVFSMADGKVKSIKIYSRPN